jgi:hypothetical protein
MERTWKREKAEVREREKAVRLGKSIEADDVKMEANILHSHYTVGIII